MKRPATYTEKVYLKVTSVFDSTGFMQPKVITWLDGREFPIEFVKDFHPAGTQRSHPNVDCYTVVIQGETKYLFFEKADRHQHSRLGRWYVERQRRA